MLELGTATECTGRTRGQELHCGRPQGSMPVSQEDCWPVYLRTFALAPRIWLLVYPWTRHLGITMVNARSKASLEEECEAKRSTSPYSKPLKVLRGWCEEGGRIVCESVSLKNGSNEKVVPEMVMRRSRKDMVVP